MSIRLHEANFTKVSYARDPDNKSTGLLGSLGFQNITPVDPALVVEKRDDPVNGVSHDREGHHPGL